MELNALLAIRAVFPEYAEGMEKGERPDWQSASAGRGLEVVQAINMHMGYSNAVFNNYLGKDRSEIPAKTIDSFKGEMFFENDRLFAGSDSKGLVSGTRHIQLALDEIEKKHEKLNSPGYSIFRENELFIFLAFSTNKQDIELFLSEYDAIAEKYENTFSRIFLFDSASLFFIIPCDAIFGEYDFQDIELRDLKELTGKLRKASEWNQGTKFDLVFNTISD